MKALNASPELIDKFKVHWFESPESLVKQLSKQITLELTALLQQQPRATLAVSGGKSPIPLLHQLSNNETIDWKNTNVTLIDERYITNNSDDSNEKLIRDHLLCNAASKTTFYGLYSCDFGCKTYTAHINQTKSIPDIDLGILGLGMDGHTASLFPCSPEFQENLITKNRYVCATPRSAPHERNSLSLSALHSIDRLYLFIPGRAKFERFEQIVSGKDQISPVYKLIKKREHPLQVYSCP